VTSFDEHTNLHFCSIKDPIKYEHNRPLDK
jgi:hypothetical protein